MSTTRICVTASDHLGRSLDEEAWGTIDGQDDYGHTQRACAALVAYLEGQGVKVGELHVGTADWVRDRWPR